MGLTRRDRKEARKTLKKINKEKQRQALLENPPNQSYKRKIIHTEIPWPLQLISMGKKDVLLFIILIVVICIAAGAYLLYLFITFIMEFI